MDQNTSLLTSLTTNEANATIQDTTEIIRTIPSETIGTLCLLIVAVFIVIDSIGMLIDIYEMKTGKMISLD